jgi:hypothetical protein
MAEFFIYVPISMRIGLGLQGAFSNALRQRPQNLKARW